MLKLGKQLRSASSLPLKIVAVQPLSAAARHTAAFSPLPHPFAGGQRADPSAKVDRCLDTIDLLAQLEGSGVADSPACSWLGSMYLGPMSFSPDKSDWLADITLLMRDVEVCLGAVNSSTSFCYTVMGMSVGWSTHQPRKGSKSMLS